MRRQDLKQKYCDCQELSAKYFLYLKDSSTLIFNLCTRKLKSKLERDDKKKTRKTFKLKERMKEKKKDFSGMERELFSTHLHHFFL